MEAIMAEHDRLLTTEEVAGLFRVEPRTVGAWARNGRLPALRTPGGHRRYKKSVVQDLLAGEASGATAAMEPACPRRAVPAPGPRGGERR